MNIKTETRIKNKFNDISQPEDCDQEKNEIILKQNWDQDSRSFKWESVEKLISQPRIVSQVRSLLTPAHFSC